jgi:hypothetical protein
VQESDCASRASGPIEYRYSVNLRRFQCREKEAEGFPLMIDRQTAIEHFQGIGVHLSIRQDSSAVFGIQCRNRSITDDSLFYLQAFREELTVIGLERTQVSDNGLRQLMDMPKLDNVDLTNTSITDAGLEFLSKIKTLEYLHVEGTRVTANGISQVRSALPNCEVAWDGD